MKSIIFNQRVTIFSNSFIGYSDTRKNIIVSKLGNVEDMGMLQPNFSVMFGPQQIISPNQIPPNAPWFVNIHGIRIEFQPNKIDIVSNKFVNTKEEECLRLDELTKLLKEINEAIPVGSITRIAYAPSAGLESTDEISVSDFWKSIIGIPDLPDSNKQEKMIRYNTPYKQSFGGYQDLTINRVVTITEGTRTETNTESQNDKTENRTIDCVIVSIDINTHGNEGNFSTDEVKAFCQEAQMRGRELLYVINNQ